MPDPMEIYYRQCFGTGSGKLVLKNLLMEAGLFDELHTPEEQAVENFAKRILQTMGTYGDVTKGHMEENEILMENLFNLPIRKEDSWLRRKLKRLLRL